MLLYTGKWAASMDNREFTELAAQTREEAIQEVLEDYTDDDFLDDEGNRYFWIGKSYKFVPIVDEQKVIDQLVNQCFDEMGGNSDGFLSASTSNMEVDLRYRLSETFIAWQHYHGLSHNGRLIDDIEFINVDEVEE